MKQFLLLFVLIIFIITNSWSQISLQPRAGVKAGLNISNLATDLIEDKNNRYGYHVGFFSLIPLSQRFGLQLEIAYNTKGAGITTNQDFEFGTNPPTEVEVYLNYFTLPVAAVYQVNKFVTFRGGLYGNLLLSSQVNAIGTDITPNVGKDDFDQFGYGWYLEAGFNVNPITLGVSYSRGINAIGNEGLPGQYMDNTRHSIIQMFVEYSFRTP